MSNRPIIVTGAAGFIGRNTVAELNRRGEQNLILVDELGKNTPGEWEKWTNLVGLHYEDLISPEEFLGMLEEGVFAEARALIHLGACSATTERDADFLVRNNYQYTRVLANWSMEHDVRYVYASSAATYGDGERGYDDADSVTPLLKPMNMYGYSKHMFDLWALKNGLLGEDADRAGIVGLKYFNVFGPYEEHKGDMRSVVSKSVQQIREEGVVRLFESHRPEYANGEQKRDFIYVKDAVDVTLHFALEDTSTAGLFNCGTGEARTWLDLARATFAALDLEPKIEFIPMPEQLQGKYQYFTEATTEKLRAAGYEKPFTPLEVAIDDYVRGFFV